MAESEARLHPGVRWSDLPLRHKGLVVVAFPLLALFLATGTFALAEHENRKAQASLDRSLALTAELRHVLGLVVDEETGTRGFLLAREERFLEPNVAARAALPEALDRLEPLTEGAQRKRLATLRSLIDRRLGVSEEMRRFPVATGSPPPALLALLDQGKGATDAIRAEVDGMEKAQTELLARTRSRAARARHFGLGAAVAGAILGFAGGIGSTILFTRGITQRVVALERDARLLEQGLPVQAAPAGADEVGRFGRALARASELLRGREADLAGARAFLERLLTAGPTAVIRVTLPVLDVVYASPNVERLFGITVAEALAPGFLRERVHPEDLSPVLAHVQRMAEGTADEAHVELRFRENNERYRWLSVLLVIETDDAGQRTGILGYLVDIDDRYRAETALREREATLRAVFEACPDIITITGVDNTLHSANAAMQRVLGHDPAALLGQPTLHLVHPDDRQAAVDASQRLLAGGMGQLHVRYRARHADGGWVVLETQGSILSTDGEADSVVALSRDVTERVGLEQAAQQAREAAEKANRAKSEFLSRMSHELRTPLNAVLGFAQLLELDELSPDQRESVAHILKGGQHLIDLIDEVLDISRIESGRINLSSEPVRVSELLADTVELIRPLASQKNVHLLSVGVECNDYVLADRQRLKQILLNLLSNAVKYNRRGGSVALSCRPTEEGRLHIDVTDTGPGIRPEHLPLLFTPFERLGAEQSGIEGSGIGLALSRRLADAMDGSLDVTTTLGEGSTFRVELPAAEGPVERYERLNGGGARPPERPSRQRRGTVLHIEDNLANVKLVERILAQRTGVEMVAAMQGRLGLELAREHRPQLILLDLHLPDLTGDEVLRRLRDHPATAAIPVVMVSADATQGEIRRLLAAGAAHYLTKPLDVRQLLRILDEVLPDGDE